VRISHLDVPCTTVHVPDLDLHGIGRRPPVVAGYDSALGCAKQDVDGFCSDLVYQRPDGEIRGLQGR
jgi:hypothetical protein